MSEEVKNENDTNNQENSSNQAPNFAESKKQRDIEKSLVQIAEERNEKNSQQRFGYFSIPYPAIVGDRAYSQNAEYHHKIVDRKVITENRNMLVPGPKSGKGPDAYFPPPEMPEKWAGRKEADEKRREEREKKKKEEEKLQKIKLKEKFPNPLRPPGPQVAFSFYQKLDDAKELPEPDGPLTREVDKRKYKIDKWKVKTEVRNIQAAPLKTGKHPNDYFSFYNVDENLQEKLKKMNEQDIQDKLDKVKQNKEAVHKAEFKPASLKLCEPFVNDRKTYELHNEVEIEELLEKYKKDKLKGKPKYEKPQNPTKHDKPFSPARLFFEGRAGLFMYKSEEFYMNNDVRYTKEYQKEKKRRGEKKNSY